MSRVGKKPVPIPAGVTVSVTASEVKVKGAKAELSHHILERVLERDRFDSRARNHDVLHGDVAEIE